MSRVPPPTPGPDPIPPVPARPSWLRSAGWVFLGLCLIATAIYTAYHGWLVDERLEMVSRVSFGHEPVPGGRFDHTRRILPDFALDGYVWIRHAWNVAENGFWQNRQTFMDNAPEGRAVHWNSFWAHWIAGLGWLDHALNGLPLREAIARCAVWANWPVLLALLTLFGLYTGVTLGGWAAGLLVVGMVAVAPFYEGFLPGYPDHHGLINATVLGTLLGLLGGGAGWVRENPVPAGRRPAPGPRAGFAFSAVFGAGGMLVSAVSTSVLLAAVGIGALVGAAWPIRPERRTGWRYDPSLWSWWGRVGAVTCLGLYLLEYFPSHLSLRLEVNHPLYALAWFGGGEILAILTACLHQRRRPTSREAGLLGLFLLAVAVLPLMVLWRGAAVYLPRHAFMFNLHRHIAEFQPLFEPARRALLGNPFLLLGPSPLLALASLGLLAVPRLSPARRASLFLAAGAMIFFGILLALQSRWTLNASATWLAMLAIAVAALHDWSDRPWARWAGAALAVAGALLLAGWSPRQNLAAERAFREQPQITPDLGRHLLWRDLGDALRHDAGAKPIRLLSSPTSSNPLSYFAGGSAVGTLYWENLSGLIAAASMHGAHHDDEALQLLKSREVTHIAFLTYENFIPEFYHLLHPKAPLEQAEQSFAFRVFARKIAPVWLRPIPYQIPDFLSFLDQQVMLLAVVPDQTESEAYFHLGEYLTSQKNPTAAAEAWRACLAAEPTHPHANLRLAEAALAAGRVEEADRHFTVGLSAVTGANRGPIAAQIAEMLSRAGRPGRALPFYRQAVAAGVGDLPILNNLAWILATWHDDSLRNGAEALALARQSLDRGGQVFPQCWDTYSAALAETGQFEPAIAAAEQALALARQANDANLVRALEERLRTYRLWLPWRERSAPPRP